MALEISNHGVLEYRAPFPSDGLYKLNHFELEDGSSIDVYRNGNEFKYKHSELSKPVIKTIPYTGDPDDFMEHLKSSVPMKVGNKVFFIRTYDRFIAKSAILTQYNSIADATKTVTQDVWAVTMISQLGTTGNSTCLVGGHAYVLIEGINEFKERIYLTTEICTKIKIITEVSVKYIDVPHNRAIPWLYEYCKFDPDWPRLDTFLRSRELVLAMLAHIQSQIDDTFAEAEAGRPHIIRFNGFSPVPEENIHNCLSWNLQELAICDIKIPLTDPPIPGIGWYVPRYHIRPLDILCRRKVEKDNPNMDNYVPEEALGELLAQEQEITRRKKDISASKIGIEFLGNCGSVAKDIFPFGFVISLPIFVTVSLIVMPIFIGVETGLIYRREKTLNKRKIEHLKTFYNG